MTTNTVTSKTIFNQIQQQPRKERSKNGLLHFVAGGTGGAVGVILTSPLEVIKTQLQARNANLLQVGKPKFIPTTPYALYHLVLRDGVGGLFKGLKPHLIGVVPARAVNFSAYSISKSLLNRMGVQDGPLLYSTAAGAAGCTVAIATGPIWLIKTRMQLQTSLKNFSGGTYYFNIFHCCVSILRNEGVGGFYRGLGASLIGVSESVFQFVLYEGIKERLTEAKKRNPEKYPYPSELSTIEYLSAAAVSKLIAAVTTYPHEVVRTRLRENMLPYVMPKYTGVLQCIITVCREEGPKALFGGMGAHVARVVPNSAIMFLTYEFVLDLANQTSRLINRFNNSSSNNNSSN
ncbi:mitochondrial substrate carrier family protein [Cavenderia fasciculata]|uniref:Mitochondrial substrate carrier family protein n=1 Tax=Cavenderia fasciculata TaxID=261658 RepID=F4Q4M4_CACFS|nr:mitochondrial substrate carrier family protein [Cavenderia fasciculata]EGG17033.1 mitochondrial substrate carrier family protein [Cavenderia fasciculata]|eukprot:XP_004355517.1 mitochondrial substrate carrier family protein [Cavenderia fasciculata]